MEPCCCWSLTAQEPLPMSDSHRCRWLPPLETWGADLCIAWSLNSSGFPLQLFLREALELGAPFHAPFEYPLDIGGGPGGGGGGGFLASFLFLSAELLAVELVVMTLFFHSIVSNSLGECSIKLVLLVSKRSSSVSVAGEVTVLSTGTLVPHGM